MDENTDDASKKFEYLQAKYLFRFPFTMTAIKWGVGLGSFFALHQYIKSKYFRRSCSNLKMVRMGKSSYSFSNLVKGFFMLKYQFYSMTIKKFEVSESTQIEELELIRDYLVYKLKVNSGISDKLLLEMYQKKQTLLKERYGQLDTLLENVNYKDYDLFGRELIIEQPPILKEQPNQQN